MSRAAEEELDDDECLGQVPETSWTVPQIPSPPTASGLYWPKSSYSTLDCAVSVPEICYSNMENATISQTNAIVSKRRRQF